jgi:CHASE3 domain sensor protein
VLSVLFIVLGFLFLGAASRNNARANTVNVELEPARQSVNELQKQVDTLNKQLGEAGK